ncbi:hypothetical protein BDR22DRAFT_524064 [Usnea florida]
MLDRGARIQNSWKKSYSTKLTLSLLVVNWASEVVKIHPRPTEAFIYKSQIFFYQLPNLLRTLFRFLPSPLILLSRYLQQLSNQDNMSTAPQLTARDTNLIAIAFMSLKDDTAIQIDYNKFAELAGYKTAASANACFLTVKKKLLAGAVLSNAATTATTPKKAKAKATTDGNGGDDDEQTPTKTAPKKRGKAIKTEPADVEAGDADTEITPSAESPKKGRAKKPSAPSNPDANGDASDVTETNTPTPKRKRGPTKPKDPNATPPKRAKKGANAEKQESMFGGDGADVVKKEEEEGGADDDERPFDAAEQDMFKQAQADDALFGTDTAGGYLA